jgi:hypothetical protein
MCLSLFVCIACSVCVSPLFRKVNKTATETRLASGFMVQVYTTDTGVQFIYTAK